MNSPGGVRPLPRLLHLILAAIAISGGVGGAAFFVGNMQGQAKVDAAILIINIYNNETVDITVQILLNGQVRRNSVAVAATKTTVVNESVTFAKPNGAYFEVKAIDRIGLNYTKYVLVTTDTAYPVWLPLDLPLGAVPPQVAMLSATATPNPYEYKLEVGSVSRAEPFYRFRVSLLNVTSNTILIANTTALVTGTIGQGGGVTLTFTDANGDGKLSGGDYFLLQGVKGTYSYKETIYWALLDSPVT